MSGLAAGIIADDLTGALDTAVPFATLGFLTLAMVAADGSDGPPLPDADVVAVNLSCREGTAAAAHARAAAAAAMFSAAPVLMKKVDSRLKGHPGPEVRAVAAIWKPEAIVVCPAIPNLGRIVRDGAVIGRGVADPIPVAPRFGTIDGMPTFYADAETDADLDALVREAPARTLFVGATGLGAALARHLASRRPRSAPAAATFDAPMAFVVGSRDPITIEQVNRLRHASDVCWLPAPDGRVPPAAGAGSVLIQAVPGADPAADGSAVAARIAEGLLAHHLGGRRTLLLTGGETAAAVLGAMGLAVLRVVGEAQPGLPLCRAVDNPDLPAIITKSGGFGDADSLLRLLQTSLHHA